ncbi:MAG: HAD-IA family hydrolase, partial [Candidatus Spechtbacterales bacterium]|nr:HAD-IA family hydrolase [Candidatus Spechtbacterales bacterium]
TSLFDKVWRRDGTDVTFEEYMNSLIKDDNNREKIIDFFFKTYKNTIQNANPLPGAESALSFAHKNYKTAIISASTTDQINTILEKNQWNQYVDLVLSQDDFKKSKPDPASYLMGAEKLNLNPDECVVIEDSKNGALAGKNAGMFVIGVRIGNKIPQDLSAANIIIDTLKEFPEKIKELGM